jgi:diamine N-acetyltransferase
MSISIREIREDNFIEAMRLKVNPDQETYVASNPASIAQSKFHTFLECYGIYDGDTMVGFSAFGKHPENETAWIVRFMIGAQHQRQGYGYAGLQAVLDHMQQTYECSSVFLDVSPDDSAAISLYEKAGFADTGDLQGKSKIFRLDSS